MFARLVMLLRFGHILLLKWLSCYLNSAKLMEEGCWEPYSKYIEQSSFSHFLSMQETNRYLLTIIALY